MPQPKWSSIHIDARAIDTAGCQAQVKYLLNNALSECAVNVAKMPSNEEFREQNERHRGSQIWCSRQSISCDENGKFASLLYYCKMVIILFARYSRCLA